MRVLIVDDEPAARARLRLLLDELGVALAGEAANGVEALGQVARLSPEVLLLDIAMPEVDGFDVVRHLGEPRPLVIFQTAYDEFALKAFDHEALDYVVKPVTRERLGQALERARRRLAERQAPELTPAVLERLAETIRPAPIRPRLLVREGRGHRLLPFAEIHRFAATDGVVYAHTQASRHLTDYTLQEIEERTGQRFVRVSRGELVRVEAIEKITSQGDGSAVLTLAGGSEVRVSRRRAAEVRERLG